MRALALLLLLPACVADVPDGGDVDDDDSPSGPICPMDPGEPSLTLVSDDDRHVPMVDGDDIVVQRQHQGAIATVIGVRWTGVDGGVLLGEFRASVTDDVGNVLAERVFDETTAPCDRHEGVGFHTLEVFYAFGGPMPDVQGLPATLEVTAAGLSDRIRGTLVLEEGG